MQCCSAIGDSCSFLAMKALRYVCCPVHPAVTLSLWTGAAVVRSLAWHVQAGRLMNLGEGLVLLAKAEAASLLLLPRFGFSICATCKRWFSWLAGKRSPAVLLSKWATCRLCAHMCC